MATIEFNYQIQGIRGRIGGTVFSANKNGPYIKQLAIPTNPKTESQTESRNHWSDLVKSFSPLPSYSKQAWNNLAQLDPEPSFNPWGHPIPHYGMSYFIKCNRRRFLLGLDPLTDPPTGIHSNRPPSSPGFLISENHLAQQKIIIGFTFFPEHPDLLFRLDTFLNNNPNTPPPHDNFTFTGALETTTGSANIFQLLTDTYGQLHSGITIWIRSSYLCPHGLQGLPHTQPLTLAE